MSKAVLQRLAPMPASVLAVAMQAGCAGDGSQPSFAVGWVMLGLLCAFLVLLFVGLIRYILAGKKKPAHAVTATPPDAIEYRVDDEDEEY